MGNDRTLTIPGLPIGVITLKMHLAFCLFLRAAQTNWVWGKTVSIVYFYDTDIGNDVDDVLALGMIHSLESRGLCRLLSVTITKDHYLSDPLQMRFQPRKTRAKIVDVAAARTAATRASGN